jgi:hypothetical protein
MLHPFKTIRLTASQIHKKAFVKYIKELEESEK